ncbi:hypothetical protein CEXT_68061 [Caerostris extrusa]|uniref:Uncharacterized protein n=1 Tax=Caerostris extrusa TaxID=172846 RepID=A0AAV4T864_CAEEX|nr:hypothetical protein CEXT_68061 [Caerostris extrusa]
MLNNSSQFINSLQFRTRRHPTLNSSLQFFSRPPRFESSHLATSQEAAPIAKSPSKASNLQGRHHHRYPPWYLNYLVTRAGMVAPRLPVSAPNEGRTFSTSYLRPSRQPVCAPRLKGWRNAE